MLARHRESSVARSVFDCDECADRGVRPDLCGGGEWKLDAAEALWGAKGGAVEGVDRVTAVEVADVADAWVVVAGPVWVGAAHRADGDVLEDGEGAELGRGGGNTGIAGGGEDGVAVVPEGERLGQAAVHVDVAVAAGAAFAGDRIGKQRLPDPCSCEPVDRQRVLVLERHHGAASDLIRGVRAPQGAQLR